MQFGKPLGVIPLNSKCQVTVGVQEKSGFGWELTDDSGRTYFFTCELETEAAEWVADCTDKCAASALGESAGDDDSAAEIADGDSAVDVATAEPSLEDNVDANEDNAATVDAEGATEEATEEDANPPPTAVEEDDDDLE